MPGEFEQQLLTIMEKLSVVEHEIKELRKLFKEASEERIKQSFTYDGEIMFRNKNNKESEL